MTKLKIKLLIFNGAPAFEKESAPGRIEKLMPAGSYEIVEDEDPDVLFFLTGGSERNAIESVGRDGFYLLIGSDKGNAYASATEVKSYLDENETGSFLMGEEETATPGFLANFLKVKFAVEALKGKRIGLIGEISGWLVNSAVSAKSLMSKFGIELVNIKWDDINHYSQFAPAEGFEALFKERGIDNLECSARVNQMLKETISAHSLDAITVECFPMVQNEGVTACLSLARFNNDGFPAGCEGDLTAVLGMMVCKELTGIVPWIANINRVSDDGCLFSHCTIAPGLLTDFSVTTHYETGKGSAVAGRFKSDTVTVFRFDKWLSKAFIAVGDVIDRPSYATACRTQIEVKMSKEDMQRLKNNPLGNHHLIFPGDCSQLLECFCKVKGITR